MLMRHSLQLASSEQHKQEYRLLELFAYGDLIQYRASAPGTYPTLTPNHLNKLRQLTLVSLASRSRVLSYMTLFRDLDLQDGAEVGSSSSKATTSNLSARDIRALEDVIIEAIYSGILSARLDQRKQRVEVESVMGRDVTSSQDIEKMSNILQEW
jgi:COP9 signalosome complex subunit 7